MALSDYNLRHIELYQQREPLASTPVEPARPFHPSPFQQAIFDELAQVCPGRHVIIRAGAGSGKTTTIEQCVKRLPPHVRNNTLVTAFNTKIADELKRRLGTTGADVRTLNSLGLQNLSGYFDVGFTNKTNGSKYYKLIKEMHRGLSGEARSQLKNLCQLARLTCVDYYSDAAIIQMAARYEVDTGLLPGSIDGWCRQVRRLLITGQGVSWDHEKEKVDAMQDDGTPFRDSFAYRYAPIRCHDFADQVWLPLVLPNIRLRQYDLIFVDEAQDLNTAQLGLILRSCDRAQARIIAVGDPNQAIYAFSGSNARSYQDIVDRLSPVELPLSVSYRCPRAVVRLAQQFVPELQPAPSAPEGSVNWITPDDFYSRVKTGDMVLCRLNAPTIKMAFKLLAFGIAAKVEGKHIGDQVKSTLWDVSRVPGFNFADLPHYAERWLEAHTAALRGGEEEVEKQKGDLEDRVGSVIALYGAARSANVYNVDGLTTFIEGMFTDDPGDYVLLSSIHKAKGLECDRVFLLEPQLVPFYRAKTPTARQQEWNLLYVAVTRARSELFLVVDPQVIGRVQWLDQARAADCGLPIAQ